MSHGWGSWNAPTLSKLEKRGKSKKGSLWHIRGCTSCKLGSWIGPSELEICLSFGDFYEGVLQTIEDRTNS